MKKNLVFTAIAGFLFTLASCATLPQPDTAELNGEWNVVSLKGESPKTEESPFIGFNLYEKRMYGNSGCNNMFGELLYNRESGALSFDHIGSTRKACFNDTFEQPFLSTLSQVKKLKKIAKKKIGLYDADGNLLITLEKSTAK